MYTTIYVILLLIEVVFATDRSHSCNFEEENCSWVFGGTWQSILSSSFRNAPKKATNVSIDHYKVSQYSFFQTMLITSPGIDFEGPYCLRINIYLKDATVNISKIFSTGAGVHDTVTVDDVWVALSVDLGFLPLYTKIVLEFDFNETLNAVAAVDDIALNYGRCEWKEISHLKTHYLFLGDGDIHDRIMPITERNHFSLSREITVSTAPMPLQTSIKTNRAEISTRIAATTTSEAEETTNRARKTTNRADKTTNRARKTTNRAEKTTNRAEKTTNRAEKTTNRAEKTTNRAEKTTNRAEKTTNRADKTTIRAETTTNRTKTTNRLEKTTNRALKTTNRALKTTNRPEKTTNGDVTTTDSTKTNQTKPPETASTTKTSAITLPNKRKIHIRHKIAKDVEHKFENFQKLAVQYSIAVICGSILTVMFAALLLINKLLKARPESGK